MVLLESVETVEKLVHKVWRAPQVPVASLAHQAHREGKEKQERKVPKVLRDTEVSLVFKVFLDLRVPLETKVYLALLAHPDLEVNPVLRVPLAVTEVLVLRVSWVHLVPVVLVVKKALVVVLAHLVLPDPLVHLASLWVTMLRLWQLCWDRDRPRAQILFKATTPTCRRVSLVKRSPTMNVANSSQRPMNNSRLPSKSSSDQKAQKIPQPRLVATWLTPTQNYLVVSCASLIIRILNVIYLVNNPFLEKDPSLLTQ